MRMSYSFNNSKSSLTQIGGNETKEEIAIKQLKGRIQDVIIENEQFDDDFYLLQWLKVQKFKVEKADAMLRASIKWRKERFNDYDQFVESEFPQEISPILKVHFDGVTKDGVPVFCLKTGGMDFRGVVEKYGRERYIRYWVQGFAKAEKLMMDFNKRKGQANKGQPITSDSVTGVYAILNFDNYSVRQTQSIETIKCQIEILKILSNYYPGIFGHGYIINASKFFLMAFKVVKSFLEGPCLTLHIFDTNDELWKAAIFEKINSNQLRLEFGGTMDQIS